MLLPLPESLLGSCWPPLHHPHSLTLITFLPTITVTRVTGATVIRGFCKTDNIKGDSNSFQSQFTAVTTLQLHRKDIRYHTSKISGHVYRSTLLKDIAVRILASFPGSIVEGRAHARAWERGYKNPGQAIFSFCCLRTAIAPRPHLCRVRCQDISACNLP